MTAALLALTSLRAYPAEPDKCQQLSSLKLAGTTVTIAESRPAGDFTPPYGEPLSKLPAFCRVAGVIQPTSDSYIRFEVWLPASG